MSEELENMEEWHSRLQQDINNLRNNQNQLTNEQRTIKDDIQKLQMSDKLQDQEISNIKATLGEIKDDTNWIRRKITGAIITTLITAVVGGLIAIAITKIYGG